MSNPENVNIILGYVCNLYIMFPVKPPFVSLHVQYMQYQIQIFHTVFY